MPPKVLELHLGTWPWASSTSQEPLLQKLPWGPREWEGAPTGKDGRAEALAADKGSEGDFDLPPGPDWVFWTHYTDEKVVVRRG